MSDEQRSAWITRLGIVGRAQARYLWLLLITGIFYLALHARVSGVATNVREDLVVPIVDLRLSAIPVWASGPIVLSVLLLAVHGSLRAFKTAATAVGVRGFGMGEEYDVAPNTLDFVVYTTADTPRWMRGVLLFTYPLYLGLFCIESWWLLVSVALAENTRSTQVLLVIGAVLTLAATWRVLSYLVNNAVRAWKVIRGDEGV